MAQDSGVARYFSEFLGTFLLVFTVGVNVLAGSKVFAVMSIACVLMVSIYALGGVSGAHFNPAVTAALFLAGKMKDSQERLVGVQEVAIYCAVQVLGGIVAGLAYMLLLFKTVDVGPADGFGLIHAGMAEALYTFVLCFVVLNCAASSKNGPNQFFGLAIGFVIVAGGYGAGAVSGGCFNPAVALGLDVTSAHRGFGWSLVYVAFELLGAAAAVLLFRVVRPDEYGGSPNYDLMPRCVSEFIGTFVLVLTVGLNVLGKSPAPVISIAAALMCMIFSLGNCSGAHFNPAVTVAIALSGRGKAPPKEAAAYMVSQVLGGIMAAFTYAFMHHGRTVALGPVAPHSLGTALAGEGVFTFVLCFVVLSVATTTTPLSEFFGLAIGACVTVGGIAIGKLSGGSLNPAVSIALAFSDKLLSGGPSCHCMSYTIAEIIGAACAAGVFFLLRPGEYSKDFK